MFTARCTFVNVLIREIKMAKHETNMPK